MSIRDGQLLDYSDLCNIIDSFFFCQTTYVYFQWPISKFPAHKDLAVESFFAFYSFDIQKCIQNLF